MTAIDEAERSALKELARTLAAELCGSAQVRAVMDADGRPDPRVDSELAATGLWSLGIPEQYGGSGAGLSELAMVLEELGSRAGSSQLLTTAVLCAGAILLGGSEEQRARWLPALAAGELTGTAALAHYFLGQSSHVVRADRRNGAWTLSGPASHVLNGRVSDLLVVPAQSAAGPLIAVIPARTAGVRTVPVSMTDRTRCLDSITLTDVHLPDEDVLATGDPAGELLGALVNRAALAVAADSLGNTRRVLDMTVTYVGQRTQFGRPIGSFQAVKHHAADMLVNTETSAVLLGEALTQAGRAPSGCAGAVSMAKEYGCDQAARNAGTALQLHGGIGYTWEHDLHIFFKRAKLNEYLFGDARWHRRRIAQALWARTEHQEERCR